MTYIPSFGKLKYIHISVDNFTGAVHTSTHTEKKSGDLIKAFSFMGILKALKTDNRPSYTSREFPQLPCDGAILLMF